jgi:hemoglobin/transferrin/lactoferrin receptor protein
MNKILSINTVSLSSILHRTWGTMLVVVTSMLMGAPAIADESTNLGTTVSVGSRIDQDLGDVVSSVSVITSEEIQEQVVSDMSDLFRYEPGLEITGRKGGAQNFNIRGMGADRVMMIKDGVRMNEGYGADGLNDVVGRGFIDVNTLKQVEVAKGAVSALYGADALGGVVSFTTKDPVDYMQGENSYLSLTGVWDGRSDEWGTGATGALRLGNWDFSLTGMYRDSDEPKNYDESLDPASIETSSALFKTVYNINDSKSIKFTYDYYNQDIDRPDNGEDHGTYLNLGPGWEVTSLTRAEQKDTKIYSLKYRDQKGWAFFDTMDLSLDFNETTQKNQNAETHNYPSATVPPGSIRTNFNSDSFEQEILSFTSVLSKALGEGSSVSQMLSYGVDANTTNSVRSKNLSRVLDDGTPNVRPGDGDSAPFPENDTLRVGAYIQDRIELMGGDLAIIPGLRYSYYDMEPKTDPAYDDNQPDPTFTPESNSDSNFSGSLGIAYEFTESLRLTAQYAQGFKVPPYDLAYFSFDHVPIFGGNGIRILPTNDLDPEESDTYELGLQGDVGDFSYDLRAYLSDYEDFISIVYIETVVEPGFFGDVDVDVFQYQNLESVRIKGAELKLNQAVTDSISMFLNASYMDGKDRTTNEYIPTIMPLSGNLGIGYTGLNWYTRGALRFSDAMGKYNDGDFTTAGYGVFDLMAGYTLGEKWVFNLAVLNILDKEYIQYSGVAGREDDGRDLSPLTQPGISVSAGVTFTF